MMLNGIFEMATATPPAPAPVQVSLVKVVATIVVCIAGFLCYLIFQRYLQPLIVKIVCMCNHHKKCNASVMGAVFGSGSPK